MVDESTESQVCPSCDYPVHAGHSKSCPTRNDESEKVRNEGYELFVKFLEKHGINKMTKEEKVSKIKELDFGGVIQTISRINGRLAFRDKKQEWSGKAAGSTVKMGGDSIENANLENAEDELKLFFEKMQSGLDTNNLHEWAGKIYFAIIFSHAFENGNGRTARNIYHLLCEDGVPPQQLTGGRVREVELISQNVGLVAMTRLFDEKGIKCKDNIAMMQKHFATIDDDDWPLHGNMGYLKFLAAREVFKNEGQDVTGVERINIHKLDAGQKQAYSEIYKNLRREWFWRIFEVCDDYKDRVAEDLDHMLQNNQQTKEVTV
jgi:hypothetical protein